MKIETKGADGKATGYLVPIWNALENPELRPEQVYLTVVGPGAVKGPHLHKVRRGVFRCIKGNVRIVVRRMDGVYQAFMSGEAYDYAPVIVMPGIPAAIYNIDGNQEAFVLNMPAPAWSKESPDEWPVEGWDASRIFDVDKILRLVNATENERQAAERFYVEYGFSVNRAVYALQSALRI